MEIHEKQSNLISQNITALRQYHKYSQEEVAEKVGVTRQAVAKWEAGKSKPTAANLAELAALFEMNVSELVGSQEPEEEQQVSCCFRDIYELTSLFLVGLSSFCM